VLPRVPRPAERIGDAVVVPRAATTQRVAPSGDDVGPVSGRVPFRLMPTADHSGHSTPEAVGPGVLGRAACAAAGTSGDGDGAVDGEVTAPSQWGSRPGHGNVRRRSGDRETGRTVGSLDRMRRFSGRGSVTGGHPGGEDCGSETNPPASAGICDHPSDTDRAEVMTLQVFPAHRTGEDSC